VRGNLNVGFCSLAVCAGGGLADLSGESKTGAMHLNRANRVSANYLRHHAGNGKCHLELG
jgi:hypothetical protein